MSDEIITREQAEAIEQKEWAEEPVAGYQNDQAPLKPDKDPNLTVHSIFLTLQGEGPFAGKPAIFIRLYGCNLQCPLCDTEYTLHQRKMMPPQIVSEVQAMAAPHQAIVVLTGGEPCRQNITPTVRMLLNTGYTVQIETNGTILPDRLPLSSERLVICVSPKTPEVNQMMRTAARYWKYVIEDGHVDDADGLPTSVLGAPIRPARPWVVRPPSSVRPQHDVWLQPVDAHNEELSRANQDAMVNSVLKHNYRASVQIHKILGLE